MGSRNVSKDIDNCFRILLWTALQTYERKSNGSKYQLKLNSLFISCSSEIFWKPFSKTNSHFIWGDNCQVAPRMHEDCSTTLPKELPHI